MKRFFLPLCISLAACALTPPANDALDQARAVYRSARADPRVATYAPVELDAAARALNEAERLWRDNAYPGEIAHQAYLAEQRSRIARETAGSRATEAEMAQASEQRNRVILEARAREAEAERDRAIARARAAEESNRVASADLTSEVRRLQAQLAELQARQTERGWILTLGSDVLFDVGQATLKPGGRRAVDNVARVMREHRERNIVIEGFSDNSGREDANQRLSERRAQAVRDALVQSGVPANRVMARGLGAAYPVASNSHAAGRQLNRRVEIQIGEVPGRAATGASR